LEALLAGVRLVAGFFGGLFGMGAIWGAMFRRASLLRGKRGEMNR
jgi:hypothetical protein